MVVTMIILLLIIICLASRSCPDKGAGVSAGALRQPRRRQQRRGLAPRSLERVQHAHLCYDDDDDDDDGDVTDGPEYPAWQLRLVQDVNVTSSTSCRRVAAAPFSTLPSDEAAAVASPRIRGGGRPRGRSASWSPGARRAGLRARGSGSWPRLPLRSRARREHPLREHDPEASKPRAASASAAATAPVARTALASEAQLATAVAGLFTLVAGAPCRRRQHSEAPALRAPRPTSNRRRRR